MKKVLRFMLLAALTMVCGSTWAQESFSEDFESVTITDANSWGYGTTLSNGWAVVGGQISATANTNYTLALKDGDKYLGKDKSKGLGGIYGSSNNAFVVTGEYSGTVTLNVANYGNQEAKIYIYEAVADGDSYTTTGSALYSKTWQKVSSQRNPEWEDATFEIGDTPKRLAIYMVRAMMDNFAASNGGEVVIPEKISNLNITNANIASTVEIETGGYVSVNYQNLANADAENAKLILYVNGVENNSIELGTIKANAGAGEYPLFQSILYDKTKIEAGEYPVYVTLTADNDGGDGVKQSEPTTVTFKAKEVETTYTIDAANVTVAYDATSYNVVATVTSTTDVEEATVELLSGTTVMATATVNLTANTPAEVTLTVEGGPFAAGTTDMQVVVANKASKWIKVTVEEAPVTPVYDLAITEILGTIDLAETENRIRVTVMNNGNQDITDARVVLTTGEGDELGESTVSAKAGAQGWCYVTVLSEGMEAGTQPVIATVEVENDATPEDNTLSAVLEVKEAPAPQATFTVAAEDVTVEYGAESFSIVATVTNTSEVDAQNVAVKLMKSIEEVETKTLETLAAGAEETVTFTIEATEEKPFEAGKSITYYVKVNNDAQTEVNVTFKEAPVEERIDLAVTAIQGAIDLDADANYLTVFVDNNGTVDINDAKVVLTVDGEEAELGEATISVKAGMNSFCSILVQTEGLEAGTLPVHAEVILPEGLEDATPDDNVLAKEVTVTGDEPATPTFTVAAENVSVEFGAESFSIVATVTNTSEMGATDVEVKLLQGTEVIETKTIATLAAGKTEDVTFTFNATEENPFVAGKTVNYFVQVANQAQATVEVTFEEEYVAPVYNVSVTDMSTPLYLDVENPFITVSVTNEGDANIVNARVTLTAGDLALGEGTVSVNAGSNGICTVYLNEGVAETLVEGQTLEVTAAIEVDGNISENASLTKTVTVATTTGINAISGLNNKNVEIYTISGQRVNNVTKGGLYIINGKKAVVK